MILKRVFIILSLSQVIMHAAAAQSPADTIVPYNYSRHLYFPELPKVYTIVESMPEYPGGEDKLLGFIAKSVHYPPVNRSDDLRSRYNLSFVVDTSGRVINKCILRPLHDDYLTDYEKSVLDVLDSLPEWKPGEMNGEKVFVRYNIPLTICIR